MGPRWSFSLRSRIGLRWSFSLRSRMGLRWSFGRIGDVGRVVLQCAFQSYSRLAVRRKHVWLIFCFGFVVIGGMFVWSFLGDAKFCGWLISWLARSFLGVIEMVIYGWLPCIAWCGVFGGRRITSAFEDKDRTLSDLKLFFFRTLLDWLGIT